MGINSVIDKINQQAKEETEQLLSECKKTAKELEESILATANKEAEEIVNVAKAEVEEYRKSENLKAALKTRKDTLALKRKLMENVYTTALNKLSELDDAALLKFSRRVIINECMPGNVTVLVGNRHFERYESILNSSIVDIENELSKKHNQECKLNFKSGNFDDLGFVFVGEKWDVDARFCSIIDSIKQDSEQKVAQILFETRG